MPERRQLPNINLRPKDIPFDQIVSVRGRNPLGEQLPALGQTLANAMSQRQELRRLAQQVGAIEKASGSEPGTFSGLSPDQAMELIKLKNDMAIKQTPKTGSKFIPVGNGMIFNTETGEYSNPPKEMQRTAVSGRGGQPKLVGMSPEGQPIIFDPASREVTSNGVPYVGEILQTAEGPEQTRRNALVKGGSDSVDRVVELLTPDVLKEIKAIRVSPGRSYSQVASPEARELYANLRNAMANELYLKTGATANPQELENQATNYLASLADNPADFGVRMRLLKKNLQTFSRAISKSQTNGTGEILETKKSQGYKENKKPLFTIKSVR